MSVEKKLTDTVDFNFIRYANCWEDADVLLQALQPTAGDKILSIASAGDNSFAFLATDNVTVHAIDVNETQIHLCEFKKAAIKHLDYNSYLQLMGFAPCTNRLEIYNSIKTYLSPKTLDWCNSMHVPITNGIIFTGKFEKYFAKFRKYILPLVHSTKTCQQLLASKTDAQQLDFYNTKFNTWRWRFLFKIFFSKFVMGRAGRDPEFLKQVQITVSEFIFNKASTHLRLQACTQNYFLHLIFTGGFGNSLPFYVRPQNFINIKRNINNITFGIGFVQDTAIAKPSFYNKANLSNIFEYMPNNIFIDVASKLHENLTTEARLAYWNLMVHRNVAESLPNLYTNCNATITKIDNGFFYKNFNLHKAI